MSVNTIKVNNSDTNYTHSIFDISEHNNNATYTDLTAALAAVPEDKQYGGMTVRYIEAPDEQYVQYRLLTDEWSINIYDWQSEDCLFVKETGNYIFSLLDSNENIIIGITKDLKLVCVDNFLDVALQTPLSLKVDISDITDNLTTERVDVPLSANQGHTLKTLIDSINERLDIIEFGVSFVSNNNYLIAIVDSDEKVLWGIKKNGELDEPTRYVETSDWLFALTDVNDNVVAGIKKSGEIYAPGLQVFNYDDTISELRSDIEQIYGFDNTVEIALGNQKSYGTYKSEIDASPLVSNTDEYFIGYKIIGKDKMTHEHKKMLAVFNHDDGFPGDLVATRRIYNKYGFKGSICAVFHPFFNLERAKVIIPNYRKWLNDGHEIGIHAIMDGSYWYYNRLYDVKPDGSTNFAPLISELRGNNPDGTGTNIFGEEITTDTTIKNAGYSGLAIYNSSGMNVKVVEATQTQLDSVNRDLCFYGDRYIVQGLEDLEIKDIMKIESATVVGKTRLQWLEYYYNKLVENIGYSSISDDIATKFSEDYDYPSGSSASSYYPDIEHLSNGKMVYYGDTSNPHYNDASYQKVGKFKKGLFKDCFSCCNWEVMDRVITCAEAFFRHYYGLNHFTDMHRHGVGYVTFSYIYDDIHYMDRNHRFLFDNHDKFYFSHRNAWISVIDVMNEHGFDILKENTSRLILDLEGQLGYYYGQKGIKSENGFGGTDINMGSFTNYISMFGTGSTGIELMSYSTFMTYMQGVDNWFKFCFENAGQSVTQNGLTMNVYDYINNIAREAVGCIGTGKVLQLSVDSIERSPAIYMAVELVFRFLKDIGYEVLSWGAGRDKILSMDRMVEGNLFPNPCFNQTLLEYLGGNSTDKKAYIPDGWYYYSGSGAFEVNKETIDGIETKVLSINGSGRIETFIWGLPDGDYKFSYDVKADVTANCTLHSYKNGDKIRNGTLINDTGNISTNEYITKEIEFTIAEPHKNIVDRNKPVSIICDGYEDNVCKLRFMVNAWSGNNILKIKNIKLYKIN